ncbi:hypothetical protein J7J37_01865 [bacterium]|nr:hypothetical protein [bacterium]
MERVRITEREKESKIPFVLDSQEDSKICPKVSRGDIFFFDFSPVNSEKERVLLLSVTTKNGKRIRFREGDDKLFLGVFPDKNDAKLFALQVVLLLESVLGIRMSFSIKKEMIIAVIS